MIVHKLPDDPEDARKVLELLHDLLYDYHAGKRRKRKRPALGVMPMPVTSIRISGAFSDVRAPWAASCGPFFGSGEPPLRRPTAERWRG